MFLRCCISGGDKTFYFFFFYCIVWPFPFSQNVSVGEERDWRRKIRATLLSIRILR